MEKKTSESVSYKLNMPRELYDALEGLARRNNSTVAEILRRGIKWEILVDDVSSSGGSVLLKKEKDSAPIEVLPFR